MSSVIYSFLEKQNYVFNDKLRNTLIHTIYIHKYNIDIIDTNSNTQTIDLKAQHNKQQQIIPGNNKN